jgi:hypothetical protein
MIIINLLMKRISFCWEIGFHIFRTRLICFHAAVFPICQNLPMKTKTHVDWKINFSQIKIEI